MSFAEDDKMDIAKLEREIENLKSQAQDIYSVIANKEQQLSKLKQLYIKSYGPLYLCRICGQPHEDQEIAENYKNLLICRHCEERALNSEGNAYSGPR